MKAIAHLMIALFGFALCWRSVVRNPEDGLVLLTGLSCMVLGLWLLAGKEKSG